MARLTYSRAGFKRKMQMATRITLFIFIEGQNNDPYFYGEICEPVLSAATVSYQIVLASQLNESGGKESLIGFHDYLGVTGSLLTTFKGIRIGAIFFLDKDLDDIFQKKKHSEHIVYTEHYTVENYLFAHGDLARAAASASSLERREFTQALGDSVVWRRAVAEAWKDWITFCIFAQKHNVGCEYRYSRANSTMNSPLDKAPETTVLEQHKVTLKSRSGMTEAQFQRAVAAVGRMVTARYRRGEHEKLFNGKWYVAVMQCQIERIAADRPYNSHGLSNRIMGALASNVDFSQPWADHFRVPLRNLITRLENG